MSNLNIGIFLGTFDPIHNGHLSIVKNLSNELDKVLIIPLLDAPHKSMPITSPAIRLQMCRVSLLGEKNIEASDLIINNQIHGYDLKIIHTLIKAYPNAKLNYIVGSDVFSHILSWPSVHELEKLVNFSIILRSKEDMAVVQNIASQLDCLCKIYDFELEEISSSMIRERIKNQQLVSRFLHPDLLSIIKSNQLYK